MLAIDHMHFSGYSNRGLKLENLLLDQDNLLKFSDANFEAPGITNFKEGDDKCVKIGTPGYRAPELLEGHPYQGKNVDIFSAGIILFMFLMRQKPFKEASSNDRYFKLL